MPSPLLDSNAYYGITSDLYGPGYYLNDGINPNAPGALALSQTSLSSNNWEIFYQEPIYLIRNYDYGSRYQLGIEEESPTLPALLLASGDLTQQWNLTMWDDGTFKVANMWLGSTQIMGVGGKNVPIPVMTTAQNGSHWSFSIDMSNTSNVAPAAPDLLQSVSLQVAPSSTSTSTSLSTLPSVTAFGTPANSPVATITITAESISSSSSSASSQSTTPRSLSADTVAGIVVAVVASALVMFGLLFFVWRRRRQQRHSLPADQAALGQQQEQYWCATIQEADTRHPASEMEVSNERERMRSRAVEMPAENKL